VHNIKFGFAFLALALIAAMPAQAQTATQNLGNVYFGVSAGVVIPDSLDVTAANISGHYDFKTGPAATLFGGYHFNDYLAGEVQLGYTSLGLDDLSIGGSTATAKVDGSLDSFFVFSNAIVTPMGRGRFSPYVGAGVGVAGSRLKINSLSFGNNTVDIGSSGSETDLAANALAGFDFALTNSLSLGARYQFLWIRTSGSANADGADGTTGDVTGHLLTATLAYHF
jgi:opacity protein-like surface antigen